MDSYQQQRQAVYGRPQPRPHQHPAQQQQQQQRQQSFALPPAPGGGSLSYYSDHSSSSGWDTPNAPTYFDDSNSGEGQTSGYSTDISSFASNSQSSGESMPQTKQAQQHVVQHQQQQFLGPVATATMYEQYQMPPAYFSPQAEYMGASSPATLQVDATSPVMSPSYMSATAMSPSYSSSGNVNTASANVNFDQGVYTNEQQQFQRMMNQAGLLEHSNRPRGASFSSVPPGLVDQSQMQNADNMLYATEPTTQSMSRSSSFSFSPDPGSIGMMGPPPRPSQRAALTFNMPFQQQQRHSQQLTLGAIAPQQPPHSPTATSNASQVYSSYGSSYVTANAASPQAALPAPSPSSFSMNPTAPSEPFDAEALGLPMPSKSSSLTNYTGVYSTTGFDMVSVLSKVASRPNPQLALGPIDLGCSFVVVDAKKWDQPIVFASETFSRLTGYSSSEIIGRNCRFLQAPDGVTVRQGEKRKYTDGNAAYHLRRHLISGQESQASLINYCKGGKPFINLVTLIPISWDISDEIAYYVGFQVDLVEQPSAIMNKSRDGSYVVNYSVSAHTIPPAIEPAHDEPFGGGDDHHAVSTPGAPTIEDVDAALAASKLLDDVADTGASGLTPANKKHFNRMLLEHCDDFVHVLSLKGSLLYVSPSAKRMLEYDPSELFGKGLATICHPSDIVSVLRELKDAASSTGPINIVYRVRRKTSGYMWMEATGRLHLEQGKGRKCVILVGRPRDVYKMSWSDLERNSGFGSHEFWSKLSLNGLYLYATPAVESVTGLKSDDIMGKTIAELSPNGDDSAVRAGLDKAAAGTMNTVRHQLKARNCLADVVTHFYPATSESDVADNTRSASEGGKMSVPTSPTLQSRGRPLAVIAQTNLFSSEVTKPRQVSMPSAPSSRMSASQLQHSAQQQRDNPGAFTLPSFASGNSSGSGSDGGSESPPSGQPSRHASFAAIPSTFKTLSQANISDNIFDELDSVRGTSWQFELHQMRLTNRKLREEKETLLKLQKSKKRKRSDSGAVALASAGAELGAGSPGRHTDQLLAVPSTGGKSPGSAGKSVKGGRSCANCGRSHSAEWRSGPTGPKTLCNACGLRWSKAKSMSAHAAAAAAAASASASQSGGSTTSASPATTDSSASSSDSLFSRTAPARSERS